MSDIINAHAEDPHIILGLGFGHFDQVGVHFEFTTVGASAL